MIIESLVTTMNGDGTPNLAPLGAVFGDSREQFELRPFAGGRTLDNLQNRGEGVLHVINQSTLFVRALTNQWSSPPPLQLAHKVAAPMLKRFCRAFEFRVRHDSHVGSRHTLMCQLVYSHIGDVPRGHCRALAGILECCIVLSRVDFLPWAEIQRNLDFWGAVIEKTGNADDLEAWDLLRRRATELAPATEKSDNLPEPRLPQ
jgi:hypothetical protein